MELSNFEKEMLKLIAVCHPFSYDDVENVFMTGGRSFDNLLVAAKIAGVLNITLQRGMAEYVIQPGR